MWRGAALAAALAVGLAGCGWNGDGDGDRGGARSGETTATEEQSAGQGPAQPEPRLRRRDLLAEDDSHQCGSVRGVRRLVTVGIECAEGFALAAPATRARRPYDVRGFSCEPQPPVSGPKVDYRCERGDDRFVFTIP